MSIISSTGSKAYSTTGSGMTAWLQLDCVYTDYADRVVYSITLKLVSTGGIIDSSYTYSLNGDTYAGPALNTSSGAFTTILNNTKFKDVVVYKNWGVENKQNISWWGNISGIGIYPNIGAVTLTLTVPGRAVTTPAAPTNVYIDGDASNTTTKIVRWTNNPATGAPYTNIFVGTSPNLVGYPRMLSGTSTSLTDTSLPADAKIRYKVWATNGASKSNATLSTTWTATPPKSPSNLNVSRVSATENIIGWTPSSTTYTEDRIWVETDGGVRTHIGTVPAVAAGTPSTFIHSSAAITSYYRYWVQPVTVIGGLEWSGPYNFAGLIPVATPPAAPELIAPIDALNLSEDQIFVWRHRPRDGAIQSRYEFQWKEVSSSTWNSTSPAVVYSNSQAYTVSGTPFVGGEEYDWRVRTWGYHADPSDWSNASFAAKIPPSVLNITVSPHDDLDPTIAVGASPVFSWEFYDPDGDLYSSTVQAKLYEETGVDIWSGVSTVSLTNQDNVTFPYTLKNGENYLVIIEATNSFGLTGQGSFEFSVDYGAPTTASVVVSFDDEQGAVVLEITNPMVDPLPVKNIISRVYSDGTETVLNANVGVNTTFVDTDAPLGVNTTYKITTISALGTASSITVDSYQTNPNFISWISAGPLYMSFCADPNVSITYEREKVLHTFAGRTKPIEFIGTMRSRKISVKGGFNIDSPSSNPTRLEAIINSGETVLYRDCFGNVFHCSIDRLSYSQSYVKIGEFTLDMTEVDYV